jgi:hypothetical protein
MSKGGGGAVLLTGKNHLPHIVLDNGLISY